MSLPAEASLMLLALALYVFDAAMLLRPGEFVLVRSGSGRWRPRFGTNGWKLAGREPFVPHLLAPWRPLARVRCNFEHDLTAPARRLRTILPAIGHRPGIAATLLLMLIFVALPVCLFVYPVTSVTVAVVVLIYATCGVVMWLVYAERTALGMGRAAFWKLCGECIVCPPFCINAVRKVSLAAPTQVSLRDVMADLASAQERERTRQALRVRILEQIDAEPEGSERMSRLRRAEQSLAAEEGAARQGVLP